MRFGDVAEFRNGMNFSKESHGRGCPLIGIPDFKNRFTPDYEALAEINPDGIATEEDFVQKHDIVFVRSNGNKRLVGRSLFIDRDIHALFSGFCIRARLKTTELDPKFCAYFTKSPYFKKSIKTSAGTNINNLNQQILSDVLIPRFSETEQQSIVGVLSALDEKIDVNERINRKLEAMTQLLYDYWFLQFDFPATKTSSSTMKSPAIDGRPYRTSGGEMLYNSELKREIPINWGVAKVGDVLAKEPASEKVPSAQTLKSGNTPVVDQSTDFICGFTNNVSAMIDDTPKIIFGDHTCVLKFVNFPFARGADGTQVIDSENKQLPPHLLYHHLKKIDLSHYGYARHFKFLKEQRLILADDEICKRFEEFAQATYSIIQNNRLENQRLAAFRDWLLPMLMSGQVTAC